MADAGPPRRPRGRHISPTLLGLGAGVVVVVAVVVIVLVSLTGSPTAPATSGNRPTGTARAAGGGNLSPAQAFRSAVQAVTHVPASGLDAVGIGSHPVSGTAFSNPVDAIKTAHTSGNGLPPVDGKPVVFFYGALWCPYCATERWANIVALSRFGTFSGLGAASSSPTDSFPDTQSFSFHGSTYTSSYVVFEPVETEGENEQPLDSLTPAQANVLSVWDPAREFPFLTIGTQYTAGLPAWLSPQLLSGLSRVEIAQSLAGPSSTAGAGIDANANYLTAAICNVDGQKPAAVCTSTGVKAAAAQLAHAPASVPISPS